MYNNYIEQNVQSAPRTYRPRVFDSDYHYELKQILAFEKGEHLIELNDSLHTGKLASLYNFMGFKWMEYMTELEIELKAILLDRAYYEPDINTYVNKRLIPFIETMTDKLNQDQNKLKIQCYINELLLLVQTICFKLWKQHPIIVLNLLKRIHTRNTVSFYDSRFREQRLFTDALNDFYGERLHFGVHSQLEGFANEVTTEPYNSRYYYPLKGEILENLKMCQDVYQFSPFQRIQIHHFFVSGGFALIEDASRNFCLAYQEIYNIIQSLSFYIDKQHFVNYFHQIQYLDFAGRLTEEDIKNAQKDAIKSLISSIDVFQYATNQERKLRMALIEMNIYLKCFRSNSLEKRIYGLQQFSDKIRMAQNNDNMMFYMEDEWYKNQNILMFLQQNQVFKELFGEKAHFELIKRSFPILQFLYTNKCLNQEDILNVMKLGQGKHESWTNMISKLASDLWEILSIEHIEAMIQHIKQKQIDHNDLNFIKSLGRNRSLDTRKEVCEATSISQRQPGKRKYQDTDFQDSQNEYQHLEVGNIVIDESQSDRVDQLKGEIVEFLLNVVHEQPQSEIGQATFQVVINMICHQFKSLRQQYLIHSFDMLLTAEPPLPVNNYITLIEKIISSTYPIETFKNSRELIQWTQNTYNYKLSMLKVLGRQKYKYLQGNLQQYLQSLEQLIKFYQFLHQDSKISAQQLQNLWKLFVDYARCAEERDLFFNWLSDTNKKFLDQEAVEYLFLSIIKCKKQSVAMLQCVTNLVLYYNVQYKVMKLAYDQYTIQETDIIGLQVIWKIFFAQPELGQKLQDFLMRVLKFKQSQQVLNQLKKSYLIELFQNIKNPSTIPFISKLLEEFEGYRLVDQGDKVIITIDNKCPDALPPKRQDIQLFTNLSVIQTKQLIGQKLNPALKQDEFDIFCRGGIFSDNKTLKDYKVNQKLTFTITKREIMTDEMQAYKETPNIVNDCMPIDADEKAQEVMMITEIQDKDFILSILKDKNWIVENAVGDLIDHGEQLQVEYQSKNHPAPVVKQQKQITDEVSFAQLISNEYIDQLFDLLNSGNVEQNQKIWSILQMIPRNKQVYKLIEQSQQDWSNLLMVENTHRLQYNLQILKEQLQCDFIEDQDEYQKRHSLRENFIFYGGLNLLIQQLNNPTEIVVIILDIFQIFLTAYALHRLPHKKEEFLQLQKIKQAALNKEEDCKICSVLILPLPKVEKPNIQGFDEAALLELVFMNHELDISWTQLLDRLLTILGVEQVYTTILSILYLQPNLFNELPIQQLCTLLTVNNEEQRKMTAYFIMTLQDIGRRNGKSYCQEFLNELLKRQTQFDELSLVIAALIGQAEDLSDLNTNFLATQIVEWIKQREIIEERFLENEDKLLQGNLLLLTSLIQKDESIVISSEFAEYIYEGLFEMHNDYYKYPIYKRKLTRKRAFQLLLELCKQEKPLVAILQHLLQNHKLIIETSELELDYGVKGSHGYVGLRNLGATCYINSLLQQFYMNKALRNGILNGQIMITEIQAPLVFDNVDQIDNILLQRKLQEHTLHQLQLLFIQLQESVKQFINPHQLIKTLKGFDGEQINVLIQQDSNEFFNLLTDKLEQEQKHTHQNNLIPRIMGGTLINQMKSLESDCDFEREKEEAFLTVSIEVKHKKNLEEALDLFVKEDVLDGENKYFCEDVNRKIDVQKRYYFKRLPNTFIFHLKRFEFDYNSMMRIKINDYFEFPLEIDMFKWTRDNIVEAKDIQDHSDYMYQLKGVVVHTGSAEGGHYYSFIRDEQNWFEFNDRSITPFKIENLKSECFGGANSVVTDWGMSTSKNAYMLFYEKVIPDLPMEIESDNPRILQKKVIQQNTIYLKNQLFCAQDYLKFIQNFVQLKQVTEPFPLTQLLSFQSSDQIGGMGDLEKKTSVKIIKLFTNFIYETLQKNKDPQMFQYNIQVLSDLFQAEPAANFWLLDFLCNQRQYVLDLLIESSQPDVRTSFSQLLIQAITIIVQHEQNYLNSDSCLDRFFTFYFDSLFNVVKNNLRRSAEYFQVIKFTLISNQQFMKYFYQKDYFKRLFSLLQEQIKQYKETNIFKLESLKSNNIDQALVQVCDILAKVIMGQKQEDSPIYLFKGQQYFELDRFWIDRTLNSDEFKSYILPMVQFQPSLIDMIKHICWRDVTITEKVIQNIVNQLLNYFIDWLSLESLSQCLEAIFKLDDGLEEVRLQALLAPIPKNMLNKGDSLLEAIKKQFDTDKSFSQCLISILANLATVIPHVGQSFKVYKPEFEFMLEKARDTKGYSFSPMFPNSRINKMITQLSLLFEEPTEQNQNQIIQEEPEPEQEQDNVQKLIELNKQNYSGNSNNEGSIGNHAPSSDTEEV